MLENLQVYVTCEKCGIQEDDGGDGTSMRAVRGDFPGKKQY